MKGIYVRALRALIGFGILTIVLLIVGIVFLPFITAPIVLWAYDRSQCSLAQTLDGGAFLQALGGEIEAVRKTSRILQIDGDLELWETPSGKFWIPDTSARQFHLVVAEQRQHIYELGASGVRTGDVVLDCGADVGTFTRMALDRGARLVVAVEPMPRKEPCLRRTFASEIAAGRVIVYPKGLWDRDDERTLFGDSVVEQKTESGWRVPLTTMDKMVSELRLERVDYIKLDIEGAENNALVGGARTLRRYKPRIVIATEHRADDSFVIPALINQLAPPYRSVCGPCVRQEFGLSPLVMHFEPED